MAKVLYGVSGEGFGHATRSKEVISHLLASGHQVKVLSYDRGFDFLSPFFDTVKISGLKFTYKHNEVRYLDTVFYNFLKTPQVVRSIDLVRTIVDSFQPDVVFTDFEPISCIVANLKQLPLISLDNQHVLTRSDVDYPGRFKAEALVAKLVTRLLIFKARRYLILSFFNCRPTEDRTVILPPLIRSEVADLQPTVRDYTLVYLTSAAENLSPILKKSGGKFIVYGLNKQDVDGSIVYKLYDQKQFLLDLAGAEAIIANAGFSLISEGLFLGKPYLAIPAKAQFEQTLNAYQLAKSNYGDYAPELTIAKLKDFNKKRSDIAKRLSRYPKNNNQSVLQAVDECLAEFL